jgi:hypothetical protein
MAKLKRMMPSGTSGLWKALMPKKNWQLLGGRSGEACDPTRDRVSAKKRARQEESIKERGICATVADA